jgi:hypothetical protein
VRWYTGAGPTAELAAEVQANLQALFQPRHFAELAKFLVLAKRGLTVDGHCVSVTSLRRRHAARHQVGLV